MKRLVYLFGVLFLGNLLGRNTLLATFFTHQVCCVVGALTMQSSVLVVLFDGAVVDCCGVEGGAVCSTGGEAGWGGSGVATGPVNGASVVVVVGAGGGGSAGLIWILFLVMFSLS